MNGYKVVVTFLVRAEDEEDALWAVEEDAGYLVDSCDSEIYCATVSNKVALVEGNVDGDEEEEENK
jgi:hypothetical protein